MKNLKVFKEFIANVKLQDQNEELLISALDVENNRLFFASSANIIYGINLSAAHETQWTIDLCLPSQGALGLEIEDQITGMDYRIEQEALILGTSAGDLLLVNPTSRTVEVVGRIEGGVETIASSPDGALLAVATGFGQLLLMTQDWEVLYEVTHDLDHNSETVMSEIAEDGFTGSSRCLNKVRISWRGDGKYFATLGGPRISEGLQRLRVWERESGTLHSCSEPKIFMDAAMDWMPSGAKVAAACNRSKDEKIPSVVFFEKNGLERSSFDLYGLTEAKIEMLAWNCNSELLATLVRYEEWSSIQVWSFSNYHWYLKQEWRYMGKNKLKFIWDPERPMQFIYWTSCGSVHHLHLCWDSAVCDDSTALVIDGMNLLVTPLSLSVVPPPMSLFKLKFQSAVQSVTFTSRGSKSHLAVGLSDGNLSVVKFPEMSIWHELEDVVYNSPIVDKNSLQIEFGNLRHMTWIDSNVLLGVLHSNRDQVCLYSNFTSDNWRQSPSMNDINNEVSILVEIELVCDKVEDAGFKYISSSGWVVKSYMHTVMQSPIVAIAANHMNKSTAFVQLRNGSVVLYTSKEGINMPSTELYKERPISLKGFLSFCPWMHAVSVYDRGNVKVLLFGLDEDGKLQLNDRIICSDCTSFAFYASAAGIARQVVTHLVYVTRKDLLFVVSVDEILHGDGSHESIVTVESQRASQNRLQGGMNNIKEEISNGIKVWERGAKLIGIINGDEAAVILQTVRGNLESIYPRKLVLRAIAGALVERRFKDAVSLVRQHRINYNVIVDYCGWKTFVEAASEFVRQVDNLSHITDFVCALKDENIMKTLYKNVLLPFSPDGKIGLGTPILITNTNPSFECNNQIIKRVALLDENMEAMNKVPAVLEAVRKALEEQVLKSPARELCILTTLACNKPPQLEEALRRIKKLREVEIATKMNDGGGASDKSNPSSEEALKHLLWLSDPESVFEVALGLYDLHLAAIVALNSQRDPKEFLPFLQELEQMSPLIMCYTIDCKLHRYESALKNIAAAGDEYFGECLQLIKSNPKIFRLGVNMFKDSGKKSVILEAWGDHLVSEKKFEEAAMAYCSSCSFHKALGALRTGGLWKEALTMGGMLRLTADEMSNLANDLCEELQALGKPADAAKIALDYCKDIQSAINLLLTAREWTEALRIGFLHGTGELVESKVKSAAIECANALILEYEEGLEKVGKYLARYLAVRQRRLLLAAKLQMEDTTKEDLDDDTASETSSNLSGMSAYTFGDGEGSNASTSPSMLSRGGRVRTRIRTRRKAHGAKIRAGSPGEEFALVEHLQSMALNSRAQEELKMLLQVLLFLGEEKLARKLESIGVRFQSCQQAAVEEAENKLAEDEAGNTASLQMDNLSISKKKQGLMDRQCWQWEVLLPP
ncbi:hypothetical protein SUGI_0049640 [Cryptomeria japonica]|uniref:elongator complex protein 1 n=1 Tax=Cryptomeria japonica TaxID=3369 RepID=UPI002408B37E|nr:elongator complex protein 1 [Cryptomeria japonica]GLJ06834.1 hypothetical protein SUGI_0049640 [Cryptomeria japonica]